MASNETRAPVCPVCSRFIPEGSALTFMRRNNLIHVGCLAAAQRRAEASPSKAPTSTWSSPPRDGRGTDESAL
jgi:hypothetical protein